MARRIPRSGIAFWGAWVLAGIVGSLLPILGISFGWSLPSDTVADALTANIVYSAIVAFPQYIVLRLLIGHSSLAGAMWIPVSVVGWLAAVLARSASAVWITNALLSIGPVEALTPGSIPFDFLTVLEGVEGITYAAFLGLAQGLLLARVFMTGSAAWLWFAANLVAAVVVWIVSQIQMNAASNQTNQTALDFLMPVAILGGLYAAVTGIALAALFRRNRKGVVPVAD
jgi:hypothetical protein